MSFDKSKHRFNKAQRRAYRNVVRDIKNMDDAKQVGKDKLTLTPKIVRDRIRRALLEVEGVKEKTAIDWSNRIFQRAQNFLQRRRNYIIKQQIYERVSKANRTKTKEEIDAIADLVYRSSMKPTKAKPLPKPEQSPEVAAVLAARKAARLKLVAQNAHMRRGDHLPKKKTTLEAVF